MMACAWWPQGPHQRQKMSQLSGDNRTDSHVHFRIGVPPFRIFNIVYRISSSQVSNTSKVSNTSRGLLLEEIWYSPVNIQYVLNILRWDVYWQIIHGIYSYYRSLSMTTFGVTWLASDASSYRIYIIYKCVLVATGRGFSDIKCF